jgi:hypothetical protein
MGQVSKMTKVKNKFLSFSVFPLAQNKPSKRWTHCSWQYLFVELTEFSATEELAVLVTLTGSATGADCTQTSSESCNSEVICFCYFRTEQWRVTACHLLVIAIVRYFIGWHAKKISVRNTAPPPNHESEIKNYVTAFWNVRDWFVVNRSASHLEQCAVWLVECIASWAVWHLITGHLILYGNLVNM